jgi:Glycosyl hydrolase family 79 C-terminal beta domain
LNAHFYLGVNLGAGDVHLAMNQAEAYVSQMPAGSLDAIEVGNEPDQYILKHFRKAPYTFEDYLAEFNTWKENIVPLLPEGIKFMGASWASSAMLPNIGSYDDAEAPALATFSAHYYVADGLAKNPPDILLEPSAATSGANAVEVAVTTNRHYKIPFRMGEMNSLGNGGGEGISNAFGSALWAIDTMFEYVNIGVDGVNWQVGMAPSNPYNPFSITSTQTAGISSYTVVVNPLYYGLLLFQAATGNNSHLLPVTLKTQANLKAWATVDISGTPRLVLINKDENASGIVDIALRGYSHAQIFRLSAPSYQSTSGITFAGQTFDGSNDGFIQGAQVTETVDDNEGVFSISMPITSAAFVVFTR